MDRYIPYLKIGFHIWQRLRKAANRKRLIAEFKVLLKDNDPPRLGSRAVWMYIGEQLGLADRIPRFPDPPVSPSDLAEYLADLRGIYADHRCDPDGGSGDGGHVDNCDCRVHWVPDVAQRIRDAVRAEEN